jgi:hypothetical protein
MKTAFAALALGAFAITASSSTSATADEPLESKIVIEAKLDAKEKKATIVLKGKDGGTYINKDYPAKCTVSIAEGGKLEKTELKKEDGKYEDAGKEGKAKSLTFSVGADKSISGECKLVACTDSSCSSPFKVSFKSN